MTYRVIDKCEFSLLYGFVNDYELIAPVQKGRSYVFGMAPALCALGARGDNPPAMRVDGNLLCKTTLPMDIDDCSGRQYPSRKGGGGYG